MKRAYLYEILSSGTNAGAIGITPPGTLTRAINTIVCDTIGITEHPSISNRYLVPGGWYDFEASAPFNGFEGFRTGITAYDASGTQLWTEWGDSGMNKDLVGSTIPIVNIRSRVEFRRCLCLPTYIEVVQYVASASASQGSEDLGSATGQSGVEERYAKLIISEVCS